MIKWCHIITFVLFVLKAIGLGFMASVGWWTVFTPMLVCWLIIFVMVLFGAAVLT